MGKSAMTSSVYVHVIEDVINKVREEFVNNGGPGENTLHELQGIWEMKMMQTGAILGPIDRSDGSRTDPAGGPVHDLNVPYEYTEEYETPTAEMLFPPTPMQTPMPTPLPGTAQTPLPGNVQTPLTGSVDNSSMHNFPTGSSSDYPTPVSDTGGSTDVKPGRPSPYMPPPSPWLNQRPPLDVNIAYVEGREDADRSAAQQPHVQVSKGANLLQGRKSLNGEIQVLGASSSSMIPQQDGPVPDPYQDMLSTPNIYNYQGVANEDYNVASTPAPPEMQASTPAVGPQNDLDDEDDEEPLNEDDDDEEDLDDVDQGEELNTQHLILAQFDKVTRAKSRWKCTLKDGIMHINNKDILFNKATGEFDF